MHVSMPPDTPPPDDARRPSPEVGGNVVDPGVLADRRAQRAEQAERSAERRAADAQILAAQLARERARLEAERDAARAEADAAREGADAAIAEAAHLKAERDELRDALGRARERLQAERPPLPEVEGEAPAAPVSAEAALAPAPVPTPAPAARTANGSNAAAGAAEPPAAWAQALRRELTVARSLAPTGAAPAPAARAAQTAETLAPVPGLARERRMVARRPVGAEASAARPSAAAERRRGDRAAPVTALALERERSSRLQAQLDESLAIQRELRLQLTALERAVAERVEAEHRIEAALRRVREELTAANALAEAGVLTAPASEGTPAPVEPAEPPSSTPQWKGSDASSPESTQSLRSAHRPDSQPQTPAPAPQEVGAPPAPAVRLAPSEAAVSTPEIGLDPARLSAARERLRAAPPAEAPTGPLREGPASPWLTQALQRLLASEPDLAGRLAAGLLPAYGLPAERSLRCDLQFADAGTLALDLQPGAATVRTSAAPRERRATDIRIAADHAGLARLLYGRRGLRRRARVRGSRRALRELRRLARAPYGIRDLADSGAAFEPGLALRLVALAIDPAATAGERFAIAHRPLAGGPVDAWLRIADGEPPAVLAAAPPEPVRLTLRCTRGAILPLIAGTDPPPGESGTLDGDATALTLLRTWIAATERPEA